MPVFMPSPDEADLSRPGLTETQQLARGVRTVVGGSDPLTPLQGLLLSAVFVSMTGHTVDVGAATPIDAVAFAQQLARRDAAFRGRILQIMILGALIMHPIPATVSARLREFAAEMDVHDEVIDIAEAYAAGALDLAAADFARNGYLADVSPARMKALHVTALAQPWAAVEADPALATRWASLAALPIGTLGRGVADFYRDRGFVYPGLPGSAPPLLAQHDWVHVLAGYGTSLENELEVFAFIARANDDPRAFSLLAMIVSLFETGTLASGAGLFEAAPGHLGTPGAATRVADAMRRGALLTGSNDFLELDWFALADRPLAVVRDSLHLTDKQLPAAVASPGPWAQGGITPYQLTAARAQASAAGVDYQPWRPDPTRS
jgi:hypothetical protein